MKNSKPGFTKTIAIALLVIIPAVLVLKFIPGTHMTFINLKDKTVLYGMVALWNACLAYLMFTVI